MSAERKCAACGRAIASDDRFCSGCGTALDSGAPAARVTRPSLDEMFAHLRSGEQRPAAILMTDVSGFSSIGERAEPEWLFHLINQVLEELVECLVAHGAHIDKYVGDEVVALFGVPIAQERSAERAVLAALAMRERLRALNQQGRFGDVSLEIHTGINVGRVMVGPVGHRAYAEYTAIGDAVNVAKRLEEEAPPGQIYVSRSVRDAVADAFEFETMRPLSLSGRREQIEAFPVLGARGLHVEGVHEAVVGAPAAARPAETSQLVQYCEEAKGGSRKCVCIVGPPGIGKSRLIADWCRSAAAQPFRVVYSVCHAYGEHFPLLPAADIIARLVGLHLEAWPPRVAGDPETATASLPIDDEARTRLVAVLRSVNQPPTEATDDGPQDLCAALTALLAHMTTRGPVCLVLEDVQWIDEATRSLLIDVVSQECAWPLMVLLSARDPAPDWLADGLPTATVRLDPLPRAVIERLIAGWAAPSLLPASTIRAICDRAEGHPYFARELARGLKRARADSPELDASLPGTLEELFLAQLDQLPLGLRRLVQGASVFGEPLSPDLLQAAMGHDARLTDALLWEAVDRGLLRTGRAPGQFVFGRRLLFEAAYATIPPTRRQEVHARIATHLIAEMDTMGRSAVHAAAHHAYLGYGDGRAIDLLLRSARQYRAQYANRQAMQAAARTLELIASVAEPRQFGHQRLEALLLLTQSYQVVGELAQAQGAIAEAEVLAEDCADQELVAKIVTSAATLHWMEGDSAEAERRFSRAYELWNGLGNDTRAAHGLVGIGLCAGQRGDRARALSLFSQAANRRGTDEWVRAAALNNMGVMLLEDGRYAEAEPYLIDGLHANERDGDRRGVAHSKCSVGELCYRLARFPEAEQWLNEALGEAADMEDVQCLTLANAYLRRIHSILGTTPEAGGLLTTSPAAVSAEYPEAEAVSRLAEVEATLLSSTEPELEELLQRLSVADEPAKSGREEPSPTEWNAHVETLCIGVETALVRKKMEAAGRIADVLARHSDKASDRHLRCYADRLLHVVRQGDATADFMAPAESGEHTAFDVRSQRVRATGGRGE